MKRMMVLLALAAALAFQTACRPVPEAAGQGTVLPLSPEDAAGMDRREAAEKLRAAGFTNIGIEEIDDLTSRNALYDGAIERIEVDGRTDFPKRRGGPG